MHFSKAYMRREGMPTGIPWHSFLAIWLPPLLACACIFISHSTYIPLFSADLLNILLWSVGSSHLLQCQNCITCSVLLKPAFFLPLISTHRSLLLSQVALSWTRLLNSGDFIPFYFVFYSRTLCFCLDVLKFPTLLTGHTKTWDWSQNQGLPTFSCYPAKCGHMLSDICKCFLYFSFHLL